MRCSLRIKRSAAKALAALPKVDRVRVVEAIDLLCETPAAGSALKGEFEGLRRLRVGHYRVVYEWQRCELVILVVRIGHTWSRQLLESERFSERTAGTFPWAALRP